MVARANASTSAALAQIRPAGPHERGSSGAGASLAGSSCSTVCPYAYRNLRTSSGSVTVALSPRGSSSRERSATSQLTPISRSITRPAIT
jgi:hypothetical protein